LKCVYHPTEEATEVCPYCNLPLCDACYTDATLQENKCKVCQHTLKLSKAYQIFNTVSCSIGIAWLVAAFLIFQDVEIMTRILYGFYGLGGALILRVVVQFFIRYFLLMGLEPHQKALVGIARYASNGVDFFLKQAKKAYEKIDDPSKYEDAFVEQILSAIMLQFNKMPQNWLEYISKQFNFKPEELAEKILKTKMDFIKENIFHQYHYQAIEPIIEICEQQERDDLLLELIDEIMVIVEEINMKELGRQHTVELPGIKTPQNQQQQQEKKSLTVLRNEALLTELALIDDKLEGVMKENNRKDDFELIQEKISQFELPEVPKGTFDALKASALAAQGGQTGGGLQAAQEAPMPSGANVISDDIQGLETTKAVEKTCAECGDTFQLENMEKYDYEDITVNVCKNCFDDLESDNHREPKKLTDIRSGKK
jgi:hypothetical protein